MFLLKDVNSYAALITSSLFNPSGLIPYAFSNISPADRFSYLVPEVDDSAFVTGLTGCGFLSEFCTNSFP